MQLQIIAMVLILQVIHLWHLIQTVYPLVIQHLTKYILQKQEINIIEEVVVIYVKVKLESQKAMLLQEDILHVADATHNNLNTYYKY